MSLPIVIKYQLTKEDYTVGLRLYNTKPLYMRMIFLVGSAVFIYFGVTSFSQDPLLSAISFLIIPLMLLSNILWRPFLHGVQASKDEKLTPFVKMVFDKSGIDVNHKFNNQKIEWNKFQNLIEGNNHFLLIASIFRSQFDIIPKRAFDSPEQVQEFKQFAERQIKEARKRK